MNNPMSSITLFDDLPDLVLIEIFSYLSSFDILWGFTSISQRITLLLKEKHYFHHINLSPAHYYQFNILVRTLFLNEVHSVIVDIDSSPLQLSQWPYLPRLTNLIIKGAREYNDIIIFLILHAATLTNLTINRNNGITSHGLSLKLFHPLCRLTELVENIILRQLPALRSLDLGTHIHNGISHWCINSIIMPLTYIRIVLHNVYDLIRLMATKPLSTSLRHLHVKLSDIYSDIISPLSNIDKLVVMSQLHTFTFVKTFLWKLRNELTFINILTSPKVMPVLKRVNLSITLNNDEPNYIKQCSIFNDHRCIDVHFALCIDDFNQNINFKYLIPYGSLSHPREVVASFFTVNDWPHIGYSSTPYLNAYSESKQAVHILWYTLPWSFEEYFQLFIPDRLIHEREIYASPSSSNKIIPSHVQVLNEQNDIKFLPLSVNLRTITLEYNDRCNYRHSISTFCTTIPDYRIIETNYLDILYTCLLTTNLRSVHIRFYFSSKFPVIAWDSLHILSLLPLLKSLRLTLYNVETLLEDEACQELVKLLPTLTDFIFCFRRKRGPLDDKNDSFAIHRKSILNLYHHVCSISFDHQYKIIIEMDGCGLMVWL